MQYYGYHRTSTKEQHLDRGITEIEKFCRDRQIELAKLYTDQQTGKNFDRPNYQMLRNDVLRQGDCLLVTEVDRLGRKKEDTLKELQYLKEKGVRIMILEIATTLLDFPGDRQRDLMLELINNMLIEVYTTFADSEMQKREKRQREGLEQMKARGDWDKMGRPRFMNQADFDKAYQRVLDGRIAPFKLMEEMQMKRSTYYKYKRQYDNCCSLGKS